jgi:outer membrane biosynthesis protein TonB
MERSEKIGLGVATVGHVLLFGLLSAGFLATPNPLKLKSPPMDVSLVDEVALQSTAPQVSTQPPPPSVAPEQGPTEDAKPAAQPEPAPEPEPTPAPPKPQPKPKPAPAPPPPKPVVKEQPPKPKEKPAPPKKEVAKTPAKPKPAPEKPAPKAKPAPEKPAAKAKPAPEKPKAAASAPAKSSKSDAKAKADAPARASGQGKADKPKGSLLGKDFLKGIDTNADAPRKPAPPPAAAMGPQQKAALDRVISEQIYPHLRLPSGADVEQLVALLDVKLDQNGRVIGKPSVIDVQGETASNRPQVSVYKERAIQAVMAASPFRNLPPEYYEQWKWLKLRVDARKAR